MFKKITTLTFTIFLLVTFSNALVAQEPKAKFSDVNIEELAQYAPMFEGQTAITETEIKKYIELLPKLIEVENEPEKIITLTNENKIDPIRFIYIAIKIPIALLIHEDPEGYKENVDKIPEVLKPNKEEIALAVKYMGEIEKAAKS